MSDEGKTFWCIVTYLGANVLFYEGYYQIDSLSGNPMRPVVGSDFNEALKLHSEAEALRILRRMHCSDFKVEEHMYA